MAAGLAYRTMFATLTLLVFAAGLAGIVINDPTRRVDVINALRDGPAAARCTTR